MWKYKYILKSPSYLFNFFSNLLRRTWNICGFLENCWWQAWFSPIQHEQSSSQHYEFNQKTSILKCKFVIGTRMNTLLWNGYIVGGDFTDRKKGWCCSLDRISKVYRYRHQKTKLKIKFHLYIGDSCHQKIKKYVTWGLKLQKFYVFFL